MLDLVGQQEILGKPVFLDLEQGNANLAILRALEHTKGAAEILRTGDQARVIHMLQESGALDYAAQKARAFAEQAIAALSVLPESEARSELRRLADYAVVRDR
jgi:octaprenyl-diphosphate synthase